MTLADRLRDLGACDEAVDWAEPYGDDHARAWAECDNAVWLLWLLAHNDYGNDPVWWQMLRDKSCADTVRKYFPQPSVLP